MTFRRDRLVVVYGDRPEEMIPALLDSLDISREIPRNMPVGIKPNLVVARPSSLGATTDPRIVESLVLYLRAKGVSDIAVLESSWIGDSTVLAFDRCGYNDLKDRLGIELINLEKATHSAHRVGGKSIRVCDEAMALGYLINVPVLKAHCQTRLTCALKNLKGLIPASEKRRFHDMGLHEPIALLNRVIRSDLIVVDGIVGDLTFEEGGNPVQMNRIMGGQDPVLIDAYAATLLGYEPREIAHVEIAARMGVGSMALDHADIVELNRPEFEPVPLPSRRSLDVLLSLIDQRNACSACVGSLLHAMTRIGHESVRLVTNCICIGQGFKKSKRGGGGGGVGVGTCTGGFDRHVPGCPPSALEIRRFLESL